MTLMTLRGRIGPSHDFETIKLAFNLWRAEMAPHLTRDEAVRLALGEWLIREGYLTPGVPADRETPVRRRAFASVEWE